MPIQVTCPSCRGMFNAPESAAGKRAKCPTCGGVIQIPTGAEPAEEIVDALPEPDAPDDVADEYGVEPPAEIGPGEERRPCPMCGEMIAAKAIKCRYCGEVLDASMRGLIQSAVGNDPRWGKVRSGLATMYYSMIVVLITMIVLVIAMVVSSAGGPGPGGDPPIPILIFMVICFVVIVGAGIASIVGHFLCASVPENTGAKGLAIGAAVCMVVNIIINFASMIGMILFILFIRRTASYLNDESLAASAGRFLVFAIAMIVGMVVLFAFAMALDSEPVLIVLGIAMIVSAIVAVAWYLRLIRSLMTTIDLRTAAG